MIDLNLQLENIKVDINGKRPISVPFGAANRYLRPLPEGDFRRRKVEDPEALAAFVVDQPGEALVQILESLSDPGDVAAIKAALDGVLRPDRWTSWWNRASKHPRILSSGSGSRLRYEVSRSAEAAGESLLDELRTAQPSNRVVIAKRLAERGPEEAAAAPDPPEFAVRTRTNQPGLAWLTAGVLAGLPDGADPAEACRTRLLESGNHLGVAFRHQRPIGAGGSPRGHRSRRPERLAGGMGGLVSPRREFAESADDRERDWRLTAIPSLLDQAVDAVFRNHAGHAAQFIWSCETMTEDGCPEPIRARMTPSLLEKLPDGLTRKEFSAFRSRSKALLDGGKVAVRILMESANEQQAARFSQRIARIDTVEPQRARLIEQAAQHGRQALPTTTRRSFWSPAGKRRTRNKRSFGSCSKRRFPRPSRASMRPRPRAT